VFVAFPDGSERDYPRAFTYWEPGVFKSVEPPRGPLPGGKNVRISTSELGAPIESVLIGGVSAELTWRGTSEAEAMLPARDCEGSVAIEVHASNGNIAKSALDAFNYYTPTIFGNIGFNVTVSNGGATALRQGSTQVVCIGAYPLRGSPEGRYFEVRVDATEKGIRAPAVGVCVKQSEGDVIYPASSSSAGMVKKVEAKQLQRVWLAGYDRGGAIFFDDGKESKLPEKTWRPVRDLKEGSRIGVLWQERPFDGGSGDAAGLPALVIFQDGEERARLPVASGRLPLKDEELYLVVDLQGVKSVSLVDGATVPAPKTELPEETEIEAAVKDDKS